MKKMIIKGVKNIVIGFAILAGFILVFERCEKDIPEGAFITNEGVLIGEYLQANTDTFGEFYKILEKIEGVSFLKAYGQYTCFVPNNEAVLEYYQETGKSSVDDFRSEEDLETLRQIVKYHICPDSISTGMFIEGGLPDTTMSGDILVTSFGEGGVYNIEINHEAKLFVWDLSFINGIVHGIDAVLEPVLLSVAELISQDTNYSIFSQALVETGLYDSLNDLSTKYTVFTESDSVLNAQGIMNYEDLLGAFSQTGSPYLNQEDSLYIWLAYHCTHYTYFLPDFDNTTYQNLTYGPLFTIQRNTDFLVNSTPINAGMSNNVAKNGVYHSLYDILTIIPIPVPVYFEFTDKLEFKTLTEYYRTKSLTPIPGTILPDGVNGIHVASGDFFKYGSGDKRYYNHDWIEYEFSTASNRLWIEFDIPPLVQDGKYIVWLCGKCYDGRRANSVDIYWDDEFIKNLSFNFERMIPDSLAMEQGLKNYTNPANQQMIGQLLDTITVTHSGLHKFKLARGAEDGIITIDMLQLIPIDENQVSLKFDMWSVNH